MNYYDLIFKRKSFHLFKGKEGNISEADLQQLENFTKTVKPLDSEIKTKIRIVKENETTCKRGAEYCIEFYSEVKGNYLRNIGYLGEQIDLYLAEKKYWSTVVWYCQAGPD